MAKQRTILMGSAHKEIAARLRKNPALQFAKQQHTESLNTIQNLLPATHVQLCNIVASSTRRMITEYEQESFLLGFQQGRELSGLLDIDQSNPITLFSEEWEWLTFGYRLSKQQRERVQGYIEGMLEHQGSNNVVSIAELRRQAGF